VAIELHRWLMAGPREGDRENHIAQKNEENDEMQDYIWERTLYVRGEMRGGQKKEEDLL